MFSNGNILIILFSSNYILKLKMIILIFLVLNFIVEKTTYIDVDFEHGVRFRIYFLIKIVFHLNVSVPIAIALVRLKCSISSKNKIKNK